jgi:hypothetical protein
MSELQLSLIVIGALVVVGVLVYNRLQERAAQRHADAAFRSGHPDALLGTPGADGDTAARPGDARPRTTPRQEPPVPGVGPDPAVDYIMELTPDSGPLPVLSGGEQWQALQRRFRDRVLVATAPSGKSLLVGLQLVTRSGVAGEAELIEFRAEVENLAAGEALKVSAQEMKSALESARELDAFCADRDIQVALHVVSRVPEGLDRASVVAIGERFGLVRRDDNRQVSRDVAGRPLFEVSDRSGAKLDAPGPLLAVSFTMDVPRAPDTRRTFEAMSRMAVAVAGEAGGSLVDDNENALDERALAAIEAQLDKIRGELELRGIVPGSALASRLFS